MEMILPDILKCYKVSIVQTAFPIFSYRVFYLIKLKPQKEKLYLILEYDYVTWKPRIWFTYGRITHPLRGRKEQPSKELWCCQSLDKWWRVCRYLNSQNDHRCETQDLKTRVTRIRDLVISFHIFRYSWTCSMNVNRDFRSKFTQLR